jgi:hypothetical protein
VNENASLVPSRGSVSLGTENAAKSEKPFSIQISSSHDRIFSKDELFQNAV